MRNSLCLALLSSTVFAASWSEATGKLAPGARVQVEHKGKLERGNYALSNANEIVIATSSIGFLAIPRAEVDRLTMLGTEAPNLTYFGNARDQLCPKPAVLYERDGAPAAAKKGHFGNSR